MKPEKDSYRLLIEHLPDAFAYHQIIVDDHGRPVDYVFLEINSAFEEMTGLKRKEIIGKKVTEILPGIENTEFDWIGTYGKVAISGKATRFESFSEPLGRWYDVSAYSDEPGYFVAVFHNTTSHKQLEKSIIENKKRYQMIVDTQQEMICHYLPDTTLVFVNQAYCQAFGLSETELIGRKFLEHTPPDYREKLVTIINRLTPEQPVITHEHQAVLPDGTLGWQEWTDQAIFNEAGELVEYQAVGRDISKSKETEQALLDSEEKHRRLFEIMAQGVVYQAADGTIISANPAAEEILGLSSDQMQGKNFMNPEWNLYREDGSALPAEEHPAMVALRTGNKVGPRIMGVYQPHKQKLIWLSINVTPLFKPGKKEPFQVYATFDDITERKKAEETMRFNSIVLNQINDHVTITNLDGDIIYVNQMEIESLKMPREKLIGSNTAIFGENPDKGATQKEIRETTKKYGIWRGEVINYNADGQELIFDCRTQVIYDELGKPIALCGVSTDISERKKAEDEIRTLNEELELRVKERTAQLEASNHELDAFSYSVSHDLRGPLNRIEGFSQALLEDYAEQLDRQGQDYLRRIGNSSKHMAELIEDLLKLSKVSRLEINREPVEISALVNVCLKELQAREPHRNLEISVTPGLVVEGDTALLRIVLENLVDNAWKYTRQEEKARIEFGLTETGDQSAYYIRDNGAGFDMKYADKVFTAFQRLHSEQEFAGTGIGLSIVSRIIKRHGGEVWAEGEPGKGACFYFTLP